MILWILLALIVLLALWALATYNKLIKLRNECHEGFATMDVYLKKRFDLIPNLVETVKGYAKHEAETLEAVVAARNKATAPQSMEDRLKDENQISGALRQIFALSENYPELKANQNFLDLQRQLGTTEEDIANARKYYNAVVKNYNNSCQMIPDSLIARMGGFAPAAMFEVTSATERDNVKVQF
ncbi:MAG: LemA family protein [Ruthenibacterium sp.]